MIYVDGPFDDKPLAKLGIPVIRNVGPGEHGISAVEVIGAKDAKVAVILLAEGANVIADPTLVADDTKAPKETKAPKIKKAK